MRKIDEIGTCPNCDCTLSSFKTQNYKRFVKCEICGLSYALPKKGTISNSALVCSRNNFPILIVDRKDQPAYFWTDEPCFSCMKIDKCEQVKDLKKEFQDLKVYGY